MCLLLLSTALAPNSSVRGRQADVAPPSLPPPWLQVGDTLWVAADLSGVTFLSKFPGLQPVQQDQVDRTGVNVLNQILVQVAVGANSALVGRTVVDLRFRQRFRAAVVAYQREVRVAHCCIPCSLQLVPSREES